MANGKTGYVDPISYDKNGDLRVKGMKKISSEDGKILYEYIDSEEE